MADLPLISYLDPIEITGLTKDNTRRTVDLAGFLTHENPKIVVMEVRRTSTVGGFLLYYMGVTGGTILTGQLGASDGTNYASDLIVIPLNGTEIDYRFVDGNFDLYLVAEFGGDNVIAFSDFTLTGRTNNAWGDQDLTSNLADVEHSGNVEGIIANLRNLNYGQAWLRRNGSADAAGTAQHNQQINWGTAKVDDGNIFERYVSRSGGKTPVNTSFIYMVGYWLRNSGLEATSDRDPGEIKPVGTDFEDFNMGKIADENEIMAIGSVRQPIDGSSPRATLRGKGSSRFSTLYVNRRTNTYPVLLDANEDAEYSASVSAFTWRIEATQYDLAVEKSNVFFIG